jgi:hypothetical protein
MIYHENLARLNPEAVLLVRLDSANRSGTEAILHERIFEMEIEEANWSFSAG